MVNMKSIFSDMNLENCRNYNIVIYGTGVIASRFINEYKSLNIIGVMDRYKKTGTFEGIKIIDWCDLKKEESNLLILCSLESNYRDIYERIKEQAQDVFLDVLDNSGVSIKDYSWANYNLEKIIEISSVSKEKLYELIDKHKYISFDIFDTLLMRRVLYPEDVFDIVQKEIRKFGIYIDNFKEKRIEKGAESKYQTLEEIYNGLKNELNLTCNQAELIMQCEINVEKKVIIAREEMVDAFKYAIDKRKNVTLISDMYLQKDILKEILDNNGVNGYNQIFVSCDVGKRKDESKGLFKYYLDTLNINKTSDCLHIGDNDESDIKKAEEEQIDTYKVFTSLDMAKITYIRNVFKNNSSYAHLVVGNIISVLFNSPFEINKYKGKMVIDSWEKFGKVFIYPIMYDYLQKLVSSINNFSNDEKILFAARDGFLPYKLYESIREKYPEYKLPDARYLYISRTGAINLCTNEEKIDVVNRIYKDKKQELKDFKEIEPNKEKARKRYKEYLKSIEVNTSKINWLCEFYAKGTTQFLIDDMFENLVGFYYMHQVIECNYPIQVKSLYKIDEDNVKSEYRYIQRYEERIERVMSSFEGKFLFFDDTNVILDTDSRSEEEKAAIEEIQEGVCDYLRNTYISNDVNYMGIIDVISSLIQCLLDGNIIFKGINKEVLNL